MLITTKLINMQSEEIAKMKKVACEAIDAEADVLNNISQEIWKNPELFYEEVKAHKLLTTYLTGKGFNVSNSHVLTILPVKCFHVGRVPVICINYLLHKFT